LIQFLLSVSQNPLKTPHATCVNNYFAAATAVAVAAAAAAVAAAAAALAAAVASATASASAEGAGGGGGEANGFGRGMGITGTMLTPKGDTGTIGEMIGGAITGGGAMMVVEE
jgi:hypothetical protein